jgi:cell division protein ZapA
MAALGIAAELLASKASGGAFGDVTVSEIKHKIAAMHSVIDTALAPQENLF